MDFNVVSVNISSVLLGADYQSITKVKGVTKMAGRKGIIVVVVISATRIIAEDADSLMLRPAGKFSPLTKLSSICRVMTVLPR